MPQLERARHTGFRGWWRENRRRFAITWGVTAASVCTVAAFAELHHVIAHGAAVLYGAVALPFVIAAAVILLVLIPLLPVVLLAAIFDADDDATETVVAGVGARVINPYFRFFARQRSPVFWGIPAGLVTALFVLAGIAYVRAAPARSAAALRAETEDQLRGLQQQIAASFARDNALPALPETYDAYGRPLVYETVDGTLYSSYRLISRGADPDDPGDDPCVAAKLRRETSTARWLLEKVTRSEPAHLRCPGA